MTEPRFITARTHPNHEVVGHLWRNFFNGHDYYCCAYDRHCGYWMKLVNASSDSPDDTRKCTNISERAIGRTFHKILRDLPYPKSFGYRL